jgi:3-oxoacyl-[acyl-carrier protein] reductase
LSNLLAGKTAVVTGASRGIGRATALALGREGATVVVNYRQSAAEAEATVRSVEEAGGRAWAHQADVTDVEQAGQMMKSAAERFGRLDILVNNAGWTRVVPHDRLDLLTEEVLERTLTVNLKAPLYCIRAAEPYLRRTGNGLVVNITSVAGVVGRGSSLIYCGAKAALSMMSRGFARVLAPEVRVNCVAPGFVDTGFGQFDKETASRVAGNNYLGRLVTVEEVAAAVVYLATSGSAITGEEIVVDGGIGRLWPRR